MDEKVKEVKIYIEDTQGGQHPYELAEVCIYKRLKNVDLKFKRLFDCNFWEQRDEVDDNTNVKDTSQMFHLIDRTLDKSQRLCGKHSRIKKLAFLKQNTVTKHIHVYEEEDKLNLTVIFAFC